MANIRATDPTNMFVRVLIDANEANIPRCGAVVEIIRKASVALLSAEDNTAIADRSRGGCGSWVPKAKQPRRAAVYCIGRVVYRENPIYGGGCHAAASQDAVRCD